MNINFTLIAQAIAFAILIWFTVKYVWPPLLSAIETRQKEIADGLAAAQEGKASLEVAAKKTTQQLNEAKQKASEIISQAEKRASEILEEAKPHRQKGRGSRPRTRLASPRGSSGTWPGRRAAPHAAPSSSR